MNKKGFTLTELLVVVVILGILAGLSIPLIRNLSSTFEKKKYQSYADSVLSASKIYNNSYSEDLFGYNDYGCAYIPYDKLIEKNLIKDIEVEDMSCNSDKTYVRVIKQQDKYGYSVYLSCGKKTKGQIEKTKVSIPNTIPAMDNVLCTGADPSNIIIETVDAQTGGDSDKNRKKTKIQLRSGTGINNNMIIYAKWSDNENDHAAAGFEKVNFKVKGNQEEMLLNGQTITSLSNELITPKENGAYYLILRVDRLEDLYAHPWKNPREEGSKFISFGPFMIDNTAPLVEANVYKCNASHAATGEVLATKSHRGDQAVFDTSTMKTAVDGWANNDNFSNGVCFVFNITDNEQIKSSTWEWNQENQAITVTNYKGFSSSRKSGITYSGEKNVAEKHSIITDGHRYARLTVKDYAGNTTVLDVDLKLDRVAPAKPSLTNPSNGQWTNQNVTLTMGATDRLSTSSTDTNGISGMGKYYYTYSNDATQTGTNDETQWVLLDKGNNKTSFSDTWRGERNSTAYIKACDKAGNCSAKANTPIKIDKTPPTVNTNVYKRDANGNKKGDSLLPNTANGTSNTFNLSSIPNNVSGWLNGANYPDGVYLEFSISDNFTLNSNNWQWNTSGKRENATGYTTLDGGSNAENYSGNEKTAISASSLSANGHRYGRFTVTDKAGNTTSVDIDVKLDAVAPSKPSITNSSKGEWTNKNVTLTIGSTDGISGMGKYYYKNGTNGTSTLLDDGNNKTSFTKTWSNEVDNTLYIKACDIAGNCSAENSTKIRIDKTAPVCDYDIYSYSNWSTSGLDGQFTCTDKGGSGCAEGNIPFDDEKSYGWHKFYDKAGNEDACEFSVYTYADTDCWDYCASGAWALAANAYSEFTGIVSSTTCCNNFGGRPGVSCQFEYGTINWHDMGGGTGYYTCRAGEYNGSEAEGCCWYCVKIEEECSTTYYYYH